ncbi:9510_t:CDS:2, partial [Gigaspora margarita]
MCYKSSNLNLIDSEDFTSYNDDDNDNRNRSKTTIVNRSTAPADNQSTSIIEKNKESNAPVVDQNNFLK